MARKMLAALIVLALFDLKQRVGNVVMNGTGDDARFRRRTMNAACRLDDGVFLVIAQKDHPKVLDALAWFLFRRRYGGDIDAVVPIGSSQSEPGSSRMGLENVSIFFSLYCLRHFFARVIHCGTCADGVFANPLYQKSRGVENGKSSKVH